MIDAHVHFWDPSTLHYPWLDETPALRRAFLPADFEALAAGPLDGVVFVEANCRPSQNAAEMEFVDGLISREPRIVGCVAFADLRDPRGRRPSLELLAQREPVVGVRHNSQAH